MEPAKPWSTVALLAPTQKVRCQALGNACVCLPVSANVPELCSLKGCVLGAGVEEGGALACLWPTAYTQRQLSQVGRWEEEFNMSVLLLLFCVNLNSHKLQVILEVKPGLYFSSFCGIGCQGGKRSAHVKHSLISVEFPTVSTVDGV